MITVLYTASNAYLPYLGISLVSLLCHNQREKVRTYIVLLEPSQNNLEKLKEVEKKYANCELHIIDGTPFVEKMKKMRMIQYRKSYAPNLRLFFGQYIDKDVDRLLYLDCDTIVMDSLTELFAMPMECVGGVVLDSLGSEYKHCLGYADEEPYFNAGVLLINVRKWNEMHYTEKLFAMMANRKYVHANLDQDYMNQLLHNEIQILGPQYNLQPHHMCLKNDVYFSGFNRKGYYTEQQINYAVNHPVIIHAYRFCGNFTWHEGNIHPALDYYRKYKQLSPWRDMPDEAGNNGFLFRAEAFCWQHMPQKLYFTLWSAMQKVYFKQHDKEIRKMANEILEKDPISDPDRDPDPVLRTAEPRA